MNYNLAGEAGEVVEFIGYEYQLIDDEQINRLTNADDHIIIDNKKVILMQCEKFINGNGCGIRSTPVLKSSLRKFKG